MILALIDIDPLKLTDEKLQAFKHLSLQRKEVVQRARKMRSFAYDFFYINLTWAQMREQ